MKNSKIEVWDKDRQKWAEQILTVKFDREGKPNLIVYLDKPNRTRPIKETDKIFTNKFIIFCAENFPEEHVKIFERGD